MMNSEKTNRPELFVDNQRYDWAQDTIDGVQLRNLASIPAGVLIFLKVPSELDRPILDDTVVDLREHKGPARFSTQAAGSQAGN